MFRLTPALLVLAAFAVAGVIAAAVESAPSPVLPVEPAAATGTAAIGDEPRRPATESRVPAVRPPETVSLPQRPLPRSPLQPGADSRVLLDGQWVSPQWVLGRAADLPRSSETEPAALPRAPSRYQPASAPLETAPGLDQVVAPPRVARYAEAPVVRFVAPREAMANLFEELSLDELNRYQFRRNRPEEIPVERPSKNGNSHPR